MRGLVGRASRHAGLAPWAGLLDRSRDGVGQPWRTNVSRTNVGRAAAITTISLTNRCSGRGATDWRGLRPRLPFLSSSQLNSSVRQLPRPMSRRSRLVLAGILAPPLGIGALAVVLAAVATHDDASIDLVPAALNGGFYFQVIGLPIAYAVELAVGLPVYRALKRRGRLTALRIVGTATMAGVALFLMMSGVAMSTDVRAWTGAAGIGATGGAVAGIAFWCLGVLERAPRPTA